MSKEIARIVVTMHELCPIACYALAHGYPLRTRCAVAIGVREAHRTGHVAEHASNVWDAGGARRADH